MLTFIILAAMHIGILAIATIPYALIGGWDKVLAVELFTDLRINALLAVVTFGVPALNYL